MCNEREEGVWFIHAGINPEEKSTISGVSPDKTTIMASSGDDCSTAFTMNVYTKDDHKDGGVGLNRKFDPALVDDIEQVFQSKWNLPEYLPFRECVKMAIQDGIVAGMEKAANKYEPILDGKDKRIQGLHEQVKFWRNSFRTLVSKCKDAVHAFDFISAVVHHSEKPDNG